MMKILLRITRGINRLAIAIASLLVVYILCHILLEITLRLFGSSTYVLDEFVGYAVATLTFLALGYSLEHEQLIRVSFVLDLLPKTHRWILDFITSFLATVFFCWIDTIWWSTVSRNFTRGTTSQSLAATPLWVPQGLVLVGISILCLTLISRALSLVIYHHSANSGAH
ncbi:TRAP transporter small permease subunit [Vibrio nitrifigilis]|nr:TRAP transporter small permease [Vibrio nitrifigilis]